MIGLGLFLLRTGWRPGLAWPLVIIIIIIMIVIAMRRCSWVHLGLVWLLLGCSWVHVCLLALLMGCVPVSTTISGRRLAPHWPALSSSCRCISAIPSLYFLYA